MSLYRGTSDAQAMTVKCPKCKQPKGQPCVYVLTLSAAKRYANGLYGPTNTRLDRVGQPTQRVHNERRTVVWAQKQQQARRLAYSKTPPVPAALRSLRMFDLAEYHQLRAWLAEHGKILWSEPRRSGSYDETEGDSL